MSMIRTAIIDTAKNVVANIVEFDGAIPSEPLPGQLWIASDSAEIGWGYREGSIVIPPAPPGPSPAQLAQTAYNAAMATGCPITSTSTPAINGNYSMDDSTRTNILGIQREIESKSVYPNKKTTMPWFDIAGVPHIFPNTAIWLPFGEAIAEYYYALAEALYAGLAGGEWVAPPAPAPID